MFEQKLQEPGATAQKAADLEGAGTVRAVVMPGELIESGIRIKPQMPPGDSSNVETARALSVLESRLVAHLLQQSAIDLEHMRFFECCLTDLAGSHGSYDRFYEAVDALARASFYEAPRENDPSEEGAWVPLFAFIGYTETVDGEPQPILDDLGLRVVRWKWSQQATAMFGRSARYGMLDIRVCNALGSRYAYPLYELGCLFVNRQYPHQTFSINELAERLGVPGSYKAGQICKQILEPACAEINKLSPYFTMEWKPGKRGARGRISTIQLKASKREAADSAAYSAKLDGAPTPDKDQANQADTQHEATAALVPDAAPPSSAASQEGAKTLVQQAVSEVRWPSDDTIDKTRDAVLYNIYIEQASGFDVDDLARRFVKLKPDPRESIGKGLFGRWRGFLMTHAKSNVPSQLGSALAPMPSAPDGEHPDMMVYRNAIRKRTGINTYNWLLGDGYLWTTLRDEKKVLLIEVNGMMLKACKMKGLDRFFEVVEAAMDEDADLYAVIFECDDDDPWGMIRGLRDMSYSKPSTTRIFYDNPSVRKPGFSRCRTA